MSYCREEGTIKMCNCRMLILSNTVFRSQEKTNLFLLPKKIMLYQVKLHFPKMIMKKKWKV